MMLCNALTPWQELELLADLDPASPPPGLAHSQQWLQQLQAAADRHLLEKSQIRDTLGLLQVGVHVL